MDADLVRALTGLVSAVTGMLVAVQALRPRRGTGRTRRKRTD